jgi:hypothetical protein
MTLYAVKALGAGKIEAYAIRWGSPAEPDRSPTKDFFTPQTDLMLDEWGWPRPILLDHMLSAEGDAAGSVGKWTGAAKDTVGVKLSGQLKTDHPMYPRLDSEIRQGRWFLSSDSAGHLVKRRQHRNGTNELVRWGLLTASLTKRPCEHRLLPVAAVKSLALKAGARHSAADATDMQTMHDIAVRQGAVCSPSGKSDDRRRRMLLELELIEIETEYARSLEVQSKDQLLRDLETLEQSLPPSSSLGRGASWRM